jgi:hypothetical protein
LGQGLTRSSSTILQRAFSPLADAIRKGHRLRQPGTGLTRADAFDGGSLEQFFD